METRAVALQLSVSLWGASNHAVDAKSPGVPVVIRTAEAFVEYMEQGTVPAKT